jgi:hypothetical protein
LAIYQVATGDTIAALDHNSIVNAIKGTTGEVLTVFTKGALLTAASTLALGTDGNFWHVTGATTITAISTAPAGTMIVLAFDSTPTLTHNGTSLILQGAVNYTTAASDVFTFVSEGSGNWREIGRKTNATLPKQSGQGLLTSNYTNATNGLTDIGVTVTLTLPTGTSGKVLLIYSGIQTHDTNRGLGIYEWNAAGSGITDFRFVSTTAADEYTVTATKLITGLSAGANIFKVQARTPSGTLTVEGSAGQPAVIEAIEL